MPPPTAEPGAKGHTDVREPNAAERSVARRTAEARATIPDLELTVEASLGEDGTGASLEARLLAACAAALREVPRANGAYRDGRFELYSRINIGVVVAAPGTYLIPTVFDADTKSPAELTAELERLRAAAQARTLPAPAFSGATFTVWDAGALGIDRAGIVINPPQAGALAAGAVREVPVVRDGRLETARSLALTLACDHRILYGHDAARFLSAVRSALQGP